MRAASLAATTNCLKKYLQGESSPHPTFLYAHRVEDHPLHLLPSMLYLLAQLGTMPLSSIEHNTS
jgi:hypothetical protein